MHQTGLQLTNEIRTSVSALGLGSDKTEGVYVDWVVRFLDLKSLDSLLSLVESKNVLLFFAKSLGLFNELKGDAFGSNANLENLVKSIGSYWRKRDAPNVFLVFQPVLDESVSAGFRFEDEFESVLYSHSQLVCQVVFVAAVLTSLDIRKDKQLDFSFFFQEFKEYPADTRAAFERELRSIFALSIALDAQIASRQASKESKTEGGSNKFVDTQSLKKIEQLEKLVDELQAKGKAAEEESQGLQKKVEELEREALERGNELRQLKFSKEDLLEKLKNKKFEFISEVTEEKDAEIVRLKMQVEWLQTDLRNKTRLFEDEKDDLHKRVQLLENLKREYEAVRVQGEREVRTQNADRAGRLQEEVKELREKLTKAQEVTLAERQKSLEAEMALQNLSMELHHLKMDKQNLEFQVKDAENNQMSIIQSDLYPIGSEEITKELSCANEVAQLESLMAPETVGGSQMEVRRLFNNYERRCLGRVRELLRQVGENEERLKDLEKEITNVREELGDATERAEFAEGKHVEKILAAPTIVEVVRKLDAKGLEGGELAQDLFKTILRREQEIVRLKTTQRRFNNQILAAEARSLDNMTLIYSVVEGFLGAEL
jgi:DNA repair exonuclease SbcCD ATPase subunit